MRTPMSSSQLSGSLARADEPSHPCLQTQAPANGRSIPGFISVLNALGLRLDSLVWFRAIEGPGEPRMGGQMRQDAA